MKLCTRWSNGTGKTVQLLWRAWYFRSHLFLDYREVNGRNNLHPFTRKVSGGTKEGVFSLLRAVCPHSCTVLVSFQRYLSLTGNHMLRGSILRLTMSTVDISSRNIHTRKSTRVLNFLNFISNSNAYTVGLSKDGWIRLDGYVMCRHLRRYTLALGESLTFPNGVFTH